MKMKVIHDHPRDATATATATATAAVEEFISNNCSGGFPHDHQIHHHHHHHHLTKMSHLSEVLEEIKQLYSIAFPMIMTGLFVYGKSLITMLFMGQLGKTVLAGGALSIGFSNITGYSLLSGLSMGMEPISSQAHGAHNSILMDHALHRTAAILLAASLPLSLLWLNVHPILLFFAQDPAISSLAATHLAFSVPSLILHSLLNPLKIYLRSQNITKPFMHASALALLLHAPLNYLLVHRLRLGLPGIALASVLSDLNLLLSILLYLHHYSSSLPSNPWQRLSTHHCFRGWKPILSLAIPSCISVCLEWWWYELMIILSGLLSNAADAVASMGILIQATSLVYIFPSAMSLAVSTRVGNELGANRPQRARASTRAALLCAVGTGLVAMWFTTAVRHKWGRTFVTDEAVASLTAMVMPVIGLCELGNCPQTTGCGALRGSARPCVGATINLGSFYGVGMPIALLMGFYMDMGLMGLWFGLLAAQATCGVLMTFVVLRTDWAFEAKKARRLTGTEEEQEKIEEKYKNPLLGEEEEC
ncbi:hypothetical protein Sjap_022410 [Stephania japonica]|uniref:Protein DETOXIFICATION n=1 Tax=Stephania japonica TaxID=461633 RepID=A0AAP0HPV2_9MAGN